MTTYLNEEEQLQLLKRWWENYGNTVVTVVLLIGAVFAVYNWWGNRVAKINIQASGLYEQLLVSVSSSDKDATIATTDLLVKEYPQSVYASLAKLFEAKEKVHAGDLESAEKSLQWTIDRSSSQAIKQIAMIRLARIYLAQNQYTKADHLLANAEDKTFEPLIQELKGDVTLAQGHPEKARDQYVQAQEGLQKQHINNALLQMKINSLPASA